MTRALLAFALMVTVGCQDPVSSATAARPVSSAAVAASAPQLLNVRIPISETLAAGCIPEAIAVAGELHSTTKIWNGADVLRIQGHQNMNLDGVGMVTGRRYRFQQVSNSRLEAVVSTQNARTDQVFRLTTISQGDAPNAYVTMNGTFLFTGGTVELIEKKWGTECR